MWNMGRATAPGGPGFRPVRLGQTQPPSGEEHHTRLSPNPQLLMDTCTRFWPLGLCLSANPRDPCAPSGPQLLKKGLERVCKKGLERVCKKGLERVWKKGLERVWISRGKAGSQALPHTHAACTAQGQHASSPGLSDLPFEMGAGAPRVSWCMCTCFADQEAPARRSLEHSGTDRSLGASPAWPSREGAVLKPGWIPKAPLVSSKAAGVL